MSSTLSATRSSMNWHSHLALPSCAMPVARSAQRTEGPGESSRVGGGTRSAKRRLDRQDQAVERIRAHYQTYATEELERLAKDRYARIEFEITWRFIADLVPPGARVLDAGSGPGRYAVALAQAGHTVSLLDLSPHCLELAEEWARVAEVTERFEALEEGDVRDLSRWPDASFDAVLLLGPLYHLLEAEERTRCVREVR